MGESNTDEKMIHESEPIKRHVKVIDTFSSTSYPPSQPYKEPEKFSRRKIITLGAAGGALVAADKISGGGIRGFLKNFLSQPKRPGYEESKLKIESAEIPTKIDAAPPIDHEVVKVLKGPTVINKLDKEDHQYKATFRRDTEVPTSSLNEPTPADNHVNWDDIKSINGVVLGKTTSFIIMDATVSKGQAVDSGGQGFYWIKLPVELKSGEKTILYLSRSNNTKEVVQASNAQLIDPPKDLSKVNQIILPEGKD